MQENSHTTRHAASYVNGFTWPGVETRIPCAKRELDANFMRDLRLVFGDANVRYVVTGYNEFAGVRGEVVVGGRGKIIETRGKGRRARNDGYLFWEMTKNGEAVGTWVEG